MLAIAIGVGGLLAVPSIAFTQPSDSSSDAVSALPVQDAVAEAETEVGSAISADIPSAFSIGSADLRAIADGAAPSTFDLDASDGEGTALSADAQAAIEDALAPFEASGVPVGFLLVDCVTGRGVSCNIDETIYGASSFKALYAAYVCQERLETGLSALDEQIESYTQDAAGTYWASGYDSLEDLLFDTIVYSSNGAFGSLREAFDGETFSSWLEAQGIDAANFDESWFPHLTVREAAMLWASAYDYLASKTDTAAWLDTLIASAETSFIRDALADVEGATVRDKAGWYSDGNGSAYSSVCDSGIVTVDGRDYLLSIMTGASWSDESVESFEKLARAVFSARSELAA